MISYKWECESCVVTTHTIYVCFFKSFLLLRAFMETSNPNCFIYLFICLFFLDILNKVCLLKMFLFSLQCTQTMGWVGSFLADLYHLNKYYKYVVVFFSRNVWIINKRFNIVFSKYSFNRFNSKYCYSKTRWQFLGKNNLIGFFN